MRVAVKVLPHMAFVTVLMTEMVTLVPSHTSLAVGGVNTQVAPHSTVRLNPQRRVGGWLSTTVTV